MKITKRQLKRIIREESARLHENKLLGGFGFGPSGYDVQEEVETTVKYNANPALKGGQTKLPDHLQKAIINKANKGKDKLKEIDGADHDGSQMDLDDYYELEDLLTVKLRDFLRGGYTKTDLVNALTNIVNDAL